MKFLTRAALVMLLVCPLYAQTPGTLNYPTSLDTSVTLFEVANNSTTSIGVELSAAATTATVGSTSSFPTTGAFSVGSEIIYYTGKTATTFTGLVRARQGTAAAIHVVGTIVQGRYTAGHHEALRSSVISLQTKLGIGSDTPASGEFLKGTGAGSSGWATASASDLSNGTTGTDAVVLANNPAFTGGTGIAVNATAAGITAAVTSLSDHSARPAGEFSDSQSFAIDRGGRVALGGSISSGPAIRTTFAAIDGRKENGTSANDAGYFAILTRPNGGSLTERFRISSTGALTLGVDLGIAEGGTGQSTATAAFDALAPTTTQGDIIYHDGTDNVRLAKGTAFQFLRMNSAATAPEWAGAATDVTHAAGNFTASSGTWTVDAADQVRFSYRMIGKEMRVEFYIQNSDVSATPTNLQITIPGGFTAAAATGQACRYQDAGGTLANDGWVQVAAGGTVMSIQKQGVAAWSTTAADNTLVIGQLTFFVQ